MTKTDHHDITSRAAITLLRGRGFSVEASVPTFDISWDPPIPEFEPRATKFDSTYSTSLLDPVAKWPRDGRYQVLIENDLFGDQIPADHIARIFAVAALSPRHTYWLWTRHPKSMYMLLCTLTLRDAIYDALIGLRNHAPVVWSPQQAYLLSWPAARLAWPPPNMRFGVASDANP